ncbi:MAG: SUMF1/EgtB/PvdO family nonheme iron enzyme [Pseudomonadota bacterium]
MHPSDATAGGREDQGGAGASDSEGGRAGNALGVAPSGGSPQAGRNVGGAAGESGGDGGSATAGATNAACDPGPSGDDDGRLLTTPSCAELVPSGCEQVQPCRTIQVPSGSFKMGRSEDANGADFFATGDTDELPEHPVKVSAYWLDKYEVTVGRFRRFVEAYDGVPPSPNAGANPRILESGWHSEWDQWLPVDASALRESLATADPTDNKETATWTDSASAGECRPINGISWYVAFAFCIWDGGRLPSEAEWEYAAAGGDEERLFPWGNTPPERRAVFNCSFAGGLSCTAGDLPHVGSVCPAWNGRFQHADLAGSVDEPTRDDFSARFYSLAQATGTDVMNLAYTGTVSTSPKRGGGYDATGDALRSAARREVSRSERSRLVGVRCARDQ